MSGSPRIVIVGGVAGGASAAARARRLSEEAQITIIERGEHISYANCGLPYHIGGVIADRDRLLVQTPAAMRSTFNIDVRTHTEAVAIDRKAKELLIRDLATGLETRLAYDKLVLSPGAKPVRPRVPGSDDPRVVTLRSLADMDNIQARLADSPTQRAVVIGGGYIGLEMAEALRERDIDVTLVELSDQVMGPVDPEMAVPLHQQLRLHGVDLRLGTCVDSCISRDDSVEVRLSTGETLQAGLVLMAIGVKPEVPLAVEAGLAIGQLGGIEVDDTMRTSDPDIFAVGDAVEVRNTITGAPSLFPLAGPANRQGRVAADNALGRSSVYRSTQGTGICKVFDLAVGMTGMCEKALKRLGIPYEKVYVHPASHASYYPGASQISLKLLFDPESGRVLGAQAVGSDGVDKRIDVLAVAVRAGLTVFELEELELSYAPPYGSAKDAVNYAGFVASNVIRGDLVLCQPEQMASLREDQVALDVRKPAEVAVGTIPGSLQIPLDELRGRLDELPKDKEIVAFCTVGMRGYVACRILSQHGFKCRNLSGGLRTFTAITGSEMESPQPSVEVCDDAGVGCAVESPAIPSAAVRTVDARGLQCPGPIMRVAEELKDLPQGEAVTVLSSDAAFAVDIEAWCRSTGNTLLGIETASGTYSATLAKGRPRSDCAAAPMGNKKTMVVFSGDFDKVVAAFIIANGAASMGSNVTMFFTFWGLNALRVDKRVAVQKTLVEKMFGWMMPRGANKLKLSQMNMGGMGLSMIKGIMRRKSVPSLPELIRSAQDAGVHLVACSMSMDLMGIKKEELLQGVELGGVAAYLQNAESGNVNLFI